MFVQDAPDLTAACASSVAPERIKHPIRIEAMEPLCFSVDQLLSYLFAALVAAQRAVILPLL